MLDVVCAVIENAEGSFLLCQRPAGKPQGSLWEFPGGKVESGESDIAALQRELREELGCEFLIGAAMDSVVHSYGDCTIRLKPYRCSVALGNEVKAIEHQSIEWVALGELANYELAPADLPIIAQLV